MNSIKKRPRDAYDQADLQSHTVRLTERIVKHQLHNYGTALDLFDAVARTLIPYLEYNERYKIRASKQLRLDTSTTGNLAHHVRAQLQLIYNNEEKTSTTTPLHVIDVSNGAASVYLENSPHGRTLQILSNFLGLEIRLVTSYIYEEVISIIPNDLLEIAPLYIAFNDVSKQFFMLDRPANVKRDDLLQHQQTLDQLVQTHQLVPMPITKPNPRCLSLFHSIAQVFKSNTADFLDTSALAMQIRDATYQQLQSKIEFYQQLSSCDLRRDCSTLIDSNYYRFQFEKAILHALAHVLQCQLIVFTSNSLEETPQLIPHDPSSNNEPDHCIVLLKNESTQRFTSARATFSLDHLFPTKDNDPVYETIDHSPIVDPKTKANNGNTFFSKTKDKFVTVVNKLVDNYGNLPKKPPATKRPAPIAEHILRQQNQTASLSSPSDVTYENTKDAMTTPKPNPAVATRRSSSTSSSSLVPPTKNSQTTTSTTSNSKQQLRVIPYKDRQTSLTRSNRTNSSSGTTMSTTVQQQKVFTGVTVEDVDESTTNDEATNNQDDDDDSFSDEANDPNQTVILRERKKKTTSSISNSTFNKKSTPYHYDHEALKRQQGNGNEDHYENDRGRDDFNHDDDIYLSTSDIVQQDRKQLQLFVNDRTNLKTSNPPVVQERKLSTTKLSNNDRQSFLIDKDAVLEVLGHNIAQRDRHILMKVLKQEDLTSKEWQRLLYLLDEYVNNPKKEKKERGLHALTLMENLDRLGYDMLEIQSTGPNHFKAVAKSILLIIEINDWFSEHICRVLHLSGPQDSRLVRHLRKLCLREWARYPDEYRMLYAQRQLLLGSQNARGPLDLSREIEKFRDEEYYRSDMCALVNQALATALAIPIHIVRASREPNSALEMYVPLRGIARPGLAVVLIASHPNAADGRYDVAVLKGHPQTLRKHRNVTFDDKPEVRSFETNAEEQKSQPIKVVPSAQATPMINPGLMPPQQAQFFPNQYLFPAFTIPANPQQQQQVAQVQQQQQQQQQGQVAGQPTGPNQVTNPPSASQAPNSPSLVRAATSTNIPKTTPVPTTMILQPQMPFIQMPQVQPTFVYTPMMHANPPQTANPNGTTTYFYTQANYPM